MSADMPHTIADWQAHAYEELGNVLAGMPEYDDPRQLANRLEAIARDLKDGFSVPVIPTSSRAEINEIKWR